MKGFLLLVPRAHPTPPVVSATWPLVQGGAWVGGELLPRELRPRVLPQGPFSLTAAPRAAPGNWGSLWRHLRHLKQSVSPAEKVPGWEEGPLLRSPR